MTVSTEDFSVMLAPLFEVNHNSLPLLAYACVSGTRPKSRVMIFSGLLSARQPLTQDLTTCGQPYNKNLCNTCQQDTIMHLNPELLKRVLRYSI